MGQFIIGGVDTEFFKSVLIMLQNKNYLYTTLRKLQFTKYKWYIHVCFRTHHFPGELEKAMRNRYWNNNNGKRDMGRDEEFPSSKKEWKPLKG